MLLLAPAIPAGRRHAYRRDRSCATPPPLPGSRLRAYSLRTMRRMRILCSGSLQLLDHGYSSRRTRHHRRPIELGRSMRELPGHQIKSSTSHRHRREHRVARSAATPRVGARQGPIRRRQRPRAHIDRAPDSEPGLHGLEAVRSVPRGIPRGFSALGKPKRSKSRRPGPLVHAPRAVVDENGRVGHAFTADAPRRDHVSRDSNR